MVTWREGKMVAGRINAIAFGAALVAAGWFGRQLIPTRPAVRAESVGCASFDNGRRPVVVIPDYLATNGVVSADRSMTEALRDAGFVPVVLPEMDRTSTFRRGQLMASSRRMNTFLVRFLDSSFIPSTIGRGTGGVSSCCGMR